MNAAKIGIPGVIAAIIGAIFLVWQTNNHAVCQSVIIQALANGGCGKANAIWAAGWILLVIGVMLVAVALATIGRPR